MQTSPTAKNEAPYRLYEFGTATAGPANTLYKLCWGWDPFSAGTTTQQNQAFSFEVGKFAMIVDTGLTCTLGVRRLQLLHREGSGKLYRGRSRLYRCQILQANMRLKALAEIYTMHTFAQLCNLNFL